MPGLGGGGYYNPTYSNPKPYSYQAPQNNYQFPTMPPTPTYQPLPPPPVIPQLPPPPVNTFLQQLQALIPKFQNLQPFAQLPPEMLALLAGQKDAAVKQFDLTKRDAQDNQLASLFGRGMERSQVSEDESGRLAIDLAAARAGIDSSANAQKLSAMQYAGQFGANSLGALAGVLGSGAGLAQSEYQNQINALLQQAGLQLQGYGMQTGNQLQQQGLNQQQYGMQSGNALQQQQMMLQLFQFLMQQQQQSGSGGFNFGGSSGGFSPSGGGGLGGQNYYSGGGTQTQPPQGGDPWAMIQQWLQQQFGGG